MKKEEIIKVLETQHTNVLSFPERGPWGSSKWRGNCSGFIQALLMYKYDVKKFGEVFAGSGTGSDVAKDMGVSYIGVDINPNPVRSDILCVDAIGDDVPYQFGAADMVFMHPPYPMINIPYAGSMFPDPTGQLSKLDIGQMDWETGMKVLNAIIMKYYASMKSGSRMGVLVGEVRRNGTSYSMLNDLVKPGKLEQMFVKLQHNCVSDGRRYSKAVTLNAAEFLIVLQKWSEYFINFTLPTKHTVDARDSKMITWRALISAVLRENGGTLHEKEVAKILRNHQKAKNTNHLDEKIRQVLQINPEFQRVSPGTYRYAA